jgi:hypothetical protein
LDYISKDRGARMITLRLLYERLRDDYYEDLAYALDTIQGGKEYLTKLGYTSEQDFEQAGLYKEVDSILNCIYLLQLAGEKLGDRPIFVEVIVNEAGELDIEYIDRG